MFNVQRHGSRPGPEARPISWLSDLRLCRRDCRGCPWLFWYAKHFGSYFSAVLQSLGHQTCAISCTILANIYIYWHISTILINMYNIDQYVQYWHILCTILYIIYLNIVHNTEQYNVQYYIQYLSTNCSVILYNIDCNINNQIVHYIARYFCQIWS